MPYYQYVVSDEVKFSDSRYEMDKCEEREVAIFKQFLSNEKNQLIALLDLFFPPRFKKKFGYAYFHPALPVCYRKRALEFIVQKIRTGGFELSGISIQSHIAELDALLLECAESKSVAIGLQCYKSYAVFDYDIDGNVLDGVSILCAQVNTISFVELLIEGDILPFELLNLEPILEIYLEWNKKKLARLPKELEDGEGWSLIDAVSYAAGFYAMRSWVTSSGYINGFLMGLPLSHQPLRWAKEIPQNMTESSGFVRPKGKIDSGKLPEVILAAQKRWNKIFQNACEAMKFGDIKHTGDENIKRSDVRVREQQFFEWAREKGALAPNIFFSGESSSGLHVLTDDAQKPSLKAERDNILSNELVKDIDVGRKLRSNNKRFGQMGALQRKEAAEKLWLPILDAALAKAKSSEVKRSASQLACDLMKTYTGVKRDTLRKKIGSDKRIKPYLKHSKKAV